MPTKKAIARPSLPELGEELLYSSSNPLASQILAKSDKDWGKAVRTHPAMKKEAKRLAALVRGIPSGEAGLGVGAWISRCPGPPGAVACSRQEPSCSPHKDLPKGK